MSDSGGPYITDLLLLCTVCYMHVEYLSMRVSGAGYERICPMEKTRGWIGVLPYNPHLAADTAYSHIKIIFDLI